MWLLEEEEDDDDGNDDNDIEEEAEEKVKKTNSLWLLLLCNWLNLFTQWNVYDQMLRIYCIRYIANYKSAKLESIFYFRQ